MNDRGETPRKDVGWMDTVAQSRKTGKKALKAITDRNAWKVIAYPVR